MIQLFISVLAQFKGVNVVTALFLLIAVICLDQKETTPAMIFGFMALATFGITAIVSYKQACHIHKKRKHGKQTRSN